jgi:hypothetical protein
MKFRVRVQVRSDQVGATKRSGPGPSGFVRSKNLSGPESNFLCGPVEPLRVRSAKNCRPERSINKYGPVRSAKNALGVWGHSKIISGTPGLNKWSLDSHFYFFPLYRPSLRVVKASHSKYTLINFFEIIINFKIVPLIFSRLCIVFEIFTITFTSMQKRQFSHFFAHNFFDSNLNSVTLIMIKVTSLQWSLQWFSQLFKNMTTL